MSTNLEKVVERAQKDPLVRFNSLAHLIDEEALKRAYSRLGNKAAVGVDGVTKEAYGQNLGENIRDLLERMKTWKYRHQKIRRVFIPKGHGKKGTRPIGVSSVEDKIVQGAITEVLGAVYEPIFSESSYGFRAKRTAHQAMLAVDRMLHREGVEVILEADIEAFFDSIDRSKLREMLKERVIDRSLLRLIGKCLHVGVLEGEESSYSEKGTTQGSILSPLLGNIYLHYALDRWFEEEVAPTLRGRARLIRYADDFVIGFEQQEDAKRVQQAVKERLAVYGLNLHPEKTRLTAMGRPKQPPRKGKGSSTFDFLGFTVYWRRTRQGRWIPAMKTRQASVRKALHAISDFCRRHRHWKRKDQHAALASRLRGHFNYFGVNGNIRSLEIVRNKVERIWLYWLRRRSQRGCRLSWERFGPYLKQFPLPKPRIVVQIWGSSP